jgi:uncharacterized protein
MKAPLFISILILMATSLFAQNLTGNWQGNIDINGAQLPILFHFSKDDSGNITGKWDSPKQNANGLPFSAINVSGDSIDLEIKMIAGSYRGTFVNNDSISGVWNQNGHAIPLNFSRSSENQNSQTTSSAYPNEKEISITSAGGSKLYGTLLSKNNQQKIAIIIAGSGPTDRNGNNPLGDDANSYKLLAHSLDSQNIATFRYDKKGVGKSIPSDFDPAEVRFEDYVKDAEKIFDYLNDTLGFKNIFFIGHSEGSLIGMLASQKKKVTGYISVAGLGRPADVVLKEQAVTQKWPDSLRNKMAVILDALKNGKEVNNVPESLAPVFRNSIQPYMISWLKYAPEKEIKKLNCPILIIQGGCDIQVKVEDANNLHSGNKKSQLDIIPTMSHTLKNAGADCINQQKTYTDGSMPIDPVLVNDVVNFIKKN